MQSVRTFLTLITIALTTVLWESCAPVFSEMQSARMLDKGQMEATGLYSNVAFGDDGETDHIQNEIGLRVNYGFSSKLNMRFAYENIFEDGQSAHVLGIGPKSPIIDDRIAAYIPIGTAFGSGVSTSDSWQIHPTLLFTIPLGENM
ncbi:MAG: hypothetical protein O2951_05535 [Bacteroidetes bacterium]|nr:hypothetical protein [Bacteroidota bacterium]